MKNRGSCEEIGRPIPNYKNKYDIDGMNEQELTKRFITQDAIGIMLLMPYHSWLEA